MMMVGELRLVEFELEFVLACFVGRGLSENVREEKDFV